MCVVRRAASNVRGRGGGLSGWLPINYQLVRLVGIRYENDVASNDTSKNIAVIIACC